MSTRRRNVFHDLCWMAGGFGLLVACGVGLARGYGTRWRVGRLGMPETIPGVPSDPVNDAIAATGFQQEIHWAMVLMFAAALGVVAVKLMAALRQQAHLRRLRAEVAPALRTGPNTRRIP